MESLSMELECKLDNTSDEVCALIVNTYILLYIYARMYVCMYVHMYACVYVRICMRACMYNNYITGITQP